MPMALLLFPAFQDETLTSLLPACCPAHHQVSQTLERTSVVHLPFSQFPGLQGLYSSLLDLWNMYLSPSPVHSELCIQSICKHASCHIISLHQYLQWCRITSRTKSKFLCLSLGPSLIWACPTFLILSPLYLSPSLSNLFMVL